MAGNNPKNWKQHAANLKRKRLGSLDKKDNDKLGIGSHIMTEGEMIVQRLSSVATGKSMKYEKMGPQEFVPFPFDELSVENLKQACSDYFKGVLIDGQKCDILASQNGPSCTKLSHIKNFKLIFVRFITNANPVSMSVGKYFERMPRRSHSPLSSINLASNIVSTHTSFPESPIKHVPKEYPKSVSISTMLKLGTAISTTAKVPELVELRKFDIGKMEWTIPTTHKLSISEKPFTKGGFREVFKGYDVETQKEYVLKTFLSQTLKALEKVNTIIAKKETIETLSKKAIQAHTLAKNVAENLIKVCHEKNAEKEFGTFFRYNQAFLGSRTNEGNNQVLMVEDFVVGDFKKFINNDGGIVHGGPDDLELLLKAECLAHFSYEKSGKNFMIVDVQGSGYTLYDPEIASSTLAIKENDCLHFCMGNLSMEAIEMFVSLHSCNRFCNMLGLQQLPKSEST